MDQKFGEEIGSLFDKSYRINEVLIKTNLAMGKKPTQKR
ncbi:hypothetical protein UNSWDHB_810 [Dehalobacter sp. UNSWDHB]|nr:hypothetical protein UNSWDHB_810 [Dehalobacter sp. UNSWDHB]